MINKNHAGPYPAAFCNGRDGVSVNRFVISNFNLEEMIFYLCSLNNNL